MSILVRLSILLGLFVIASPGPALGQDVRPNSKPLENREIRLLDLSGTPYERGHSHGLALKTEIQEMIAGFREDLESTYKIDASDFIERFIAETDFIPAINKWTPGLLDEVRGIADGSGISFNEIYVYQLGDEFWSMGRWAMKHKCTAIAVDRRSDQPTIVAQNMDLPRFYQKYPTILRIHYDNRPDAMVLTCPGLIGINGMNSNSVAVACNTLLQLKPSPKGVPCLFVVRGILERENRETAEEWLKKIPHAVGQNYTIGDANSATAFECSATTKTRFRPDPDGNYTYHTNHPLVNFDWHPEYLSKCKLADRTPEEGLAVCHRFEALQERIKSEIPVTRQTIIETLASRDSAQGPICGNWNYACTVFILGESPELHIAPGRADRYAMQTFRFD